jgi:hypothetical protein
MQRIVGFRLFICIEWNFQANGLRRVKLPKPSCFRKRHSRRQTQVRHYTRPLAPYFQMARELGERRTRAGRDQSLDLQSGYVAALLDAKLGIVRLLNISVDPRTPTDRGQPASEELVMDLPRAFISPEPPHFG